MPTLVVGMWVGVVGAIHAHASVGMAPNIGMAPNVNVAPDVGMTSGPECATRNSDVHGSPLSLSIAISGNRNSHCSISANTAARVRL
jgi:hypothetical protein